MHSADMMHLDDDDGMCLADTMHLVGMVHPDVLVVRNALYCLAASR